MTLKIAIDAYLDNNLGDDLMIKLFANYFSEHEIFIFENEAIIQSSFEDVDNITFLDPNTYNDELKKMDLHVTIGGSMFILDTLKKWIRFRHRIYNAKLIKKIGIKSVIIGSNLGPFDQRKFGFFLTKWELKYKNLVTVRDHKSYTMLQESGIKVPIYEFPDMVFSQDVIRKSLKYSLGISVYRSKSGEINNFSKYKSLAKIVDAHVQNTGGIVGLFAFDSENENDLVAAHYIKKLSQFPEKIEIIPYLNDSKRFIDEFARTAKVLGIRFHSSVLALKLGIPLFSIYYSNKTKNLMRDLNLDEYTASLSEFETRHDQINLSLKQNKLAVLTEAQREMMMKNSLGHFKVVEDLIREVINQKQLRG